jgi:hypothetical protein
MISSKGHGNKFYILFQKEDATLLSELEDVFRGGVFL